MRVDFILTQMARSRPSKPLLESTVITAFTAGRRDTGQVRSDEVNEGHAGVTKEGHSSEAYEVRSFHGSSY